MITVSIQRYKPLSDSQWEGLASGIHEICSRHNCQPDHVMEMPSFRHYAIDGRPTIPEEATTNVTVACDPGMAGKVRDAIALEITNVISEILGIAPKTIVTEFKETRYTGGKLSRLENR